MSLQSGLSILALVISIITTIWIVAFKWAGLTQKLNTIEQNGCPTLQDIKTSVTKLELQMKPFWNIVETTIAQSLHHPDTPVQDSLGIRLSDNLSLKDLVMYENYLRQSINSCLADGGDKSKLTATALVLSRVLTKIELKQRGLE